MLNPVEIPEGFDFGRVAAVYSDGGCIGPNPSPRGGTWAFCYVDRDGERVFDAAGVIEPADIGLTHVTNNLTEFAALLFAVECLPKGWRGHLYTDSGVTLTRFDLGPRAGSNGIPRDLWSRMVLKRSYIGYDIHLLGGHPTKADLAAGFRAKDGKPVSIHNVHCDHKCCEQARLFIAEMGES